MDAITRAPVQRMHGSRVAQTVKSVCRPGVSWASASISAWAMLVFESLPGSAVRSIDRARPIATTEPTPSVTTAPTGTESARRASHALSKARRIGTSSASSRDAECRTPSRA